MKQLDSFTVQQVLEEQRKTGRRLEEIIECLRDEGHLDLTDDEIKDCAIQCDLVGFPPSVDR